jgi:hypothetical protein
MIIIKFFIAIEKACGFQLVSPSMSKSMLAVGMINYHATTQ